MEKTNILLLGHKRMTFTLHMVNNDYVQKNLILSSFDFNNWFYVISPYWSEHMTTQDTKN